MTIYHRLVAALALAATMLCAAAPVRADTTIYSPSATPILATDWTDLGAGPADLQHLSVGTVYIAGATSKPSSSVLGSVLTSSQGKASYSVSTRGRGPHLPNRGRPMSRRALFDRREVLVGGALATLAAAEAAARPIGAHGIAALSQGVPAGYTVGLINGVPASFNGRPVFAKPNGSSLIYL